MHSTHLLDLHRATFIENLKACLLLTQEIMIRIFLNFGPPNDASEFFFYG